MSGRIIIVGAGLGGLTAAIQCHQQGAEVILLEAFAELKVLGDFILLGSNGTRLLDRLPGFCERLEKYCSAAEDIELCQYNGEHIVYQGMPALTAKYGRSLSINRGRFHEELFKYALEKGVDIRLGHSVTEWHENDEEAWVVVNGEKLVGDVVLIGDGSNSKGRRYVLGSEEPPNFTGYSVYRAYLPVSQVVESERVAALMSKGDYTKIWLGSDMHAVSASFSCGTELSWALTVKDPEWDGVNQVVPVTNDEVLLKIPDWDPNLLALVKSTKKLVKWKLVYRDPLPTWISKKSRLCLIGDAAHPFLPTSAQGGSIAIEDGFSIAACLSFSKVSGMKKALHVFQKLRYDRVAKAQAEGAENRQKWHKTSPQVLNENPNLVKVPREDWLMGYDAEKHVFDGFNEALCHIDAEFIS